ncbi:PIG-X [Phaeosphaeriaceae sp. PMI808]|nr:PIG-X [Phaeosphaeriaceae sp. PMI808]
MKQRITYVVTKPELFTPEQLEVSKDEYSMSVKGVHAAKEHRFTFGLEELPEEFSAALQQWQALYIRWTSPTPYTATPPFTSRVSPGLHVLLTPVSMSPEQALCEQLHSLINHELKCSSLNETVVMMPTLSERFSRSTRAQYYAYLPSINSILLRAHQKICNKADLDCQILVTNLATASYVDVDYDTITRAVIITAGWASARGEDGWTEFDFKNQKDGPVEIGVLTHEPNSDPEDIQFGGFLTVLGQDSSPKPTRFQTPTRHYPLLSPNNPSPQTPKLHPLTYKTAFQQPTGLHPTLTLTFPAKHLSPPNPTCKLHTHLTLPSYLFIDKYQFTDPLFLSSKHLVALHSLAGATDLEAPDWTVKQWGSAALLELAHPVTEADKGDWNVSIPLHLRYMPAANTSHTRLPVPWPVVFWACRANEGAKMAGNPFDRVHLGYEALFGDRTRFMHVEPEVRGVKELVEWIEVPVLDLRRTGWVEIGTVGTVVVAFLGLCWVLFGRGGGVKVEKEKEKEKKKQ